MRASHPLILGSFGVGSYGPTLHLELQGRDGVAWLKDMFLSMRDSRNPELITSRPEVSFQGQLVLELVHATAVQGKQLFRIADGEWFRWVCTAEEWLTNAMLLDPFLEGRAGHQYMTREGIDDALVEVSFGEA
jgi:hypothetical protein